MPKSKRWFIISGICLILTGIWQLWEGWVGLRADIPLEEWLVAGGAGGFLVFWLWCKFGTAAVLTDLTVSILSDSD